MRNLEKIENEIKQLPPQDLTEFRAWFEKFDSEHWDRQFEIDARSGKLDNLAKNAIKDFKCGKFKKI